MAGEGFAVFYIEGDSAACLSNSYKLPGFIFRMATRLCTDF